MTAPAARRRLSAALGAKLVDNRGTVYDTDAVTSEKAVIVQFGAYECQPCRRLTLELAQVYSDLRRTGRQCEVVYVSADPTSEEFCAYFSMMPWLAVPFESSDQRKAMISAFEIEAIPVLALFDDLGNLVSSNARGVISTRGAAGFPWTDAGAELTEKHA